MTQPESAEMPDPIRTFTYADVAQNIRKIEVGDMVEVPDFRKNFDALTISLANLHVNPLFSGYFTEGETPPSFESRLIGAVAVHGRVGLDHKNQREKYKGWPSDKRLPSELIKPRTHHGDIRNASITFLGKSVIQVPNESTIRRVDLLLQGDVYSTGRGIRAHSAARLEVMRGGPHVPRINYEKLSGKDAEAIVAAMHKESRDTSFKVTRRAKMHPYSGGTIGQN